MSYGHFEDVDYEYNARLDYTHELAQEHYDPEWNYSESSDDTYKSYDECILDIDIDY